MFLILHRITFCHLWPSTEFPSSQFSLLFMIHDIIEGSLVLLQKAKYQFNPTDQLLLYNKAATRNDNKNTESKFLPCLTKSDPMKMYPLL